LEQLTALLPTLVPARVDDLVEIGIIEKCDGHYCVPSPSLLQLARDALAAGYDADRVLGLLGAIAQAADCVADAVVAALAEGPRVTDRSALEALEVRGRGLLAHGTGRFTIHALGRRLGITDEDSAPNMVRQLLGVDDA
jgi:hypothetical protein